MISQADDGLIQNQPLAFAFPFPGGATSAVSISTNGWVKLSGAPVSGSSQFSPDLVKFFAEEPRIAAHWDDLDNEGVNFVATLSGALIAVGLKSV